MRAKLIEATQNKDLAFLAPEELDACVMGLSKTAEGQPAVVYDFRGCVEAMQARGQTELRARASLQEQASRLGVVLVDTTLAAPHPRGSVTVATNEEGDAVAVTRTDEDHRILSVIWERGSKEERAEHARRRADERRQIDAIVGRAERN